VRAVSLLLLVATFVFFGCESPETQIAKAKKFVDASAPPASGGDHGETTSALDLRSADIESERYLPVLERLERRQQTIERVLTKQHETRS
jgi:uncharacterized lipoprotein YajG